MSRESFRSIDRFTRHLLESAGIRPSMHVLDVGTDIGDVAFLVAERVGTQRTVIGVELNPKLLYVARRAQAADVSQRSYLAPCLRTNPRDWLS